MDFRIPGNHRSSDNQHHDHNCEFHVALTKFCPQRRRENNDFKIMSQRSAYTQLPRRQQYLSGGRESGGNVTGI
jgi:hypothetical protein